MGIVNKLIPGAEAATKAAQVGEHFSRVISDRSERSRIEAQTEHEIATNSPGDYAEAKRHEKNKSLGKTAIIAGVGLTAVLAAGGVVVYGINSGGSLLRDTVGSIFGSVKPKQISMAEAQATMENIKFSDDVPLLEGGAEGSLQIHTENHLLGLFNQPGGEGDTFSSRTMTIKTGIDDKTNNAITLKPVRINEGSNEFGTVIEVDSDALYVDTVNAKSLQAPLTQDGRLRGFWGAVLQDSNDASRQQVADDYVDTYTTASCAPLFNSVLDASVIQQVDQATEMQIATLESYKAEGVDVGESIQVLKGTLKYKPVVVWTGKFSTAASIDLPGYARPVPTDQELATAIGSDPDPDSMQTYKKDDCTASKDVVSEMIAMNEDDKRPDIPASALQNVDINTNQIATNTSNRANIAERNGN